MSLIPKRYGIDDFFDDFFPKNELIVPEAMKCDIYEKDGNYHLEMDIPGFKKEDLEIECENGYLTIVASKKEEQEDETKNYIRKERRYNKYQRSFYVGDVDSSKIKADFKDGILAILIPKEEKVEKKSKIEIK